MATSRAASEPGEAGAASVAGAERTASTASARWIELGAATLSQFGGSLAQQGTVVLGVFFASAYSLSLAQMGALVSSMTLGLMVSGLVVGALVDRFGPRAVLFTGTLCLSLIAAAVALASSLVATAALLFLLGLFLSVVPLSGTKAVLMSWPRERRGLPMGIRQMGVPIGATVAALSLPGIADHIGPHAIYWGFALLLGICGLLFCSILPKQSARASATATAAPAVPLRREAPALLVPAVSGFLLAWGQYAVLTYTIPMLRDDGALSLAVIGAVLATSQIGGAAGRAVFGAISDRVGGRRDLVLALAASAAALLAVVVALLPRHASPLVLFPLWLALGATMVGWNALMLTWAGERVSVANAGAGMGMTTSAILFGATISAPLFGLIVQVSGSYQVAWLTLAAILGTAALLLWFETRRESRRTRAQRVGGSALVGR